MVTSLLPESKQSPRPKVRPNFRPDLEGMRAVAVLAVVADHLFGWPSGGFVGVDIFFVLSGFFITGLLLRERNKTGTVSFRNFYVRRVRRIIPAALLVLCVTVIFGYLVFPAVRAKETLIDALWSSIFMANWRFEQVGTDYFQEGLPPSPIQHFWSLSIEEQFYFVWPVLLLGLFYVTRKAHRRGKSAVRHTALAGFMSAMVLASFVWAVNQSAGEPTSAYFSTFTRVWELGIGALVAIAGPALAKIPHGAIRVVIAYVGLTGVAASLFLINSETQFPGPGAVLPVLSTALVVASFHGSTVYGMAPLTNPTAQYFGKISYSLYLWHWPVIVLLVAVMPKELPYYIVALLLGFALAHISFTFYEDPIRKSKWLERDSEFKRNGHIRFRISNQAWTMTGFILIAALTASLMAIQISDRNASVGEAYESLVVADPPMAGRAPTIDPCFGAAVMRNASAACEPVANPDQLVPKLDAFEKDKQGAFSCWRELEDPLKPCTYGSTKPDALKVALVGDSHAAMLLPGLANQVVGLNWSLTTYVGNGCQWQLRDNQTSVCQPELRPVQDQFVAGQYDVIITSAARQFGLSDKGLAAQAYSRAWQPVIQAGTRVIVVADNPSVKAESLDCVTRFRASVSDIEHCGATRDEALSNEDPLVRAVAQTPGATLVDMTDFFCTADSCPMTIGGVLVYRDSSGHITGTYSRSLGPFLVEQIKSQL